LYPKLFIIKNIYKSRSTLYAVSSSYTYFLEFNFHASARSYFILESQIEAKTKNLLNLPSKKSNHQKLLKKFFKIAENHSEFYKSLNYNDKRVIQNIMFLEGFKFSLKNKECRTIKVNMILYLTNSFKDDYIIKKEKIQTQNVLKSPLVVRTGLEPVTFGL